MIQSTVYTAGGTRISLENLWAIVVRAQLPYSHHIDQVGAIGPSGLTTGKFLNHVIFFLSFFRGDSC